MFIDPLVFLKVQVKLALRLKFSRKNIFRVGFDILLLSTEIQTELLVTLLDMTLDHIHNSFRLVTILCYVRMSSIWYHIK